MTAQIASAAAALVIQRLTGPNASNANLAALTSGLAPLAPLNAAQIRTGNIAPDLADKSSTVKFPAANVYCEKLVNSQLEKFRSFSGAIAMAIDLRHSEDRVDNVQSNLELYADAVMGVLSASVGDWGNGMYYSGGYQVAFGPVKHGGKNFIQNAKITFEIGVSIT